MEVCTLYRGVFKVGNVDISSISIVEYSLHDMHLIFTTIVETWIKGCCLRPDSLFWANQLAHNVCLFCYEPSDWSKLDLNVSELNDKHTPMQQFYQLRLISSGWWSCNAPLWRHYKSGPNDILRLHVTINIKYDAL